MREATGELNMTVIVFAAVALLTALFFFIVWPMIKQGLREDEFCANAICDPGFNEAGKTYCRNPEIGTSKLTSGKDVFECPYRG